MPTLNPSAPRYFTGKPNRRGFPRSINQKGKFDDPFRCRFAEFKSRQKNHLSEFKMRKFIKFRRVLPRLSNLKPQIYALNLNRRAHRILPQNLLKCRANRAKQINFKPKIKPSTPQNHRKPNLKPFSAKTNQAQIRPTLLQKSRQRTRCPSALAYIAKPR